MLREGYIPINFWQATEPPVRVRIILSSLPAPAALFVNGNPTGFSTVADLYMLPEDIKTSTLQRDGYAPCHVADSIIAGLQIFNGGEALKAECKLIAIVTTPAPPGDLRRGHGITPHAEPPVIRKWTPLGAGGEQPGLR